MDLILEELITGIQNSRKHFLKHVAGMTAEQWDWKPYADCMSARETIAHLMGDDIAAKQSLLDNAEPNYEAALASASSIAATDSTELLAQLASTHAELCEAITATCANKPLDSTISVWGTQMKIAQGIPHFSSEDYYHSGQVAFMRMATDPAWNYYAAIYGE